MNKEKTIMQKIKGILILFFITYFWISALTNSASAGGINVDRAIGVCQADTSLSQVSFDLYKSHFIKMKVKKWNESKDNLDTQSQWEDNMYFLMDAWGSAGESCIGGNKDECNRIIEHTKYLADNKALRNRYSKDDWDFVWESKMFGGHGMSHILFAYSIAIQQVGIDTETHTIIGKWARKSVNSNSNLNMGEHGPQNHHLNFLRSLSLYGLIWNDEKALKRSEKFLLKYLKTINKDGIIRNEAVRGHRGLYYSGKAIHAIFVVMDILNDAGHNLYTDKNNETLNRAVNFYLDASNDNMLIYPYAKKRRHNKLGDPKHQEQSYSQNAWAPAFIFHYKDIYPNTVAKIYENDYVVEYFFYDVGRKDGSLWGIMDSKCFLPGDWVGEYVGKKNMTNKVKTNPDARPFVIIDGYKFYTDGLFQ
jgi:hypothetical protein